MFLESCLLIAFLNTADPSGKTIYPSGVKDNGNYIFNAPPASIYPLLNIIDPIVLCDGRTIPKGIYAVKPSIDEKSLLFIDGHNIVFELPIIENILVAEYKHKPIIKMEETAEGIFFTYQIENILKRAQIIIKKDF